MTVVSDTPVPMLDSYHWFALHDGLLYAPDRGLDQSGSRIVHGLRVLDVSDPLHVADQGIAEIDPQPNDIAFAGDVAVVASYASGVRTLDMSDPMHPRQLGVVETPRGGLRRVVADGGHAYGLNSWGLYAVDIGDPTQPTELAHLQVPGDEPYLPVLVGDRLLLTADGAIHDLDVSDPHAITLRAAFHTVGSAEAGVAVRDGWAFVGTSEGLRAIDVRDPHRPRDTGGVMLPFPSSEVQILGSRAYVSGGYFVCCGTVSVLDLTDASRPKTLGTVAIVGNPGSTAVRPPYLLVSSTDSDIPGVGPWDGVRLRMYDVSDPAAPTEGVEIPHGGTVANVSDLFYLFDGELLRVLDVSPLGEPTTVSSQAFPHSIMQVHAVGDHVYAAETNRLHIIDVTSPRSPVVVGESNSIGGHAMATDGACLYTLRDRGTGTDVQVASLANPEHPRLVHTLQSVGGLYGARGIAADQGHLYLTSSEQGLTVLGPTRSSRPTTSPTAPHPTATPWPQRLVMPIVGQ